MGVLSLRSRPRAQLTSSPIKTGRLGESIMTPATPRQDNAIARVLTLMTALVAFFLVLYMLPYVSIVLIAGVGTLTSRA